MKRTLITASVCFVFSVIALIIGYKMGIEKGIYFRMKLEANSLQRDFAIYADRESDPALKKLFLGQRDSYKLIADSVEAFDDPPNILLPRGF